MQSHIYTIKILQLTNYLVISINILLIVVPALAILFLFVTGVIQYISSIILNILLHKLNKFNELLFYHLLGSSSALVMLFGFIYYKISEEVFIGLFFILIFLAFFFIYILMTMNNLKNLNQ